MTDVAGRQFEERGSIEVRVRRHGVVVHEEWCDTPEQAAEVVDAWGDADGVEVDVFDRLRGDPVDIAVEVAGDDAYPAD
ncbi:MAG: hypothetical protein Q8M22_04485 [Actinomycetota bacterium]|nr:hypothetical protein [Actinomycetota bacterium]